MSLGASMKLSDGWMKDGNLEQYDVGLDEAVVHNVSPSMSIRFTSTDEPAGFGSLCKIMPAQNFLDKRLRMTGFVKTEHVDGAGLWMRVDGVDKETSLAFDNMFTRQIKNSTEWKRYEVVLDISSKAVEIVYGAILYGKGQVWLADVNFEEVGNDVATTVKKSRKPAART